MRSSPDRPRSSELLHLGLLSICIATGLSCGGGGGGGSTPPPGGGISGQTINVGASGNFFSPSSLTVKAGTPVTFVWLSGGHSIVSGSNCTSNGLFGNATIMSQGQILVVPVSVTNTPGTYPYFCTVHCGSSMTGTLTVTP